MKTEHFSVPAAVGVLSFQKSDRPDSVSFTDTLKSSMDEVKALQNQADAAIDDLILGGGDKAPTCPGECGVKPLEKAWAKGEMRGASAPRSVHPHNSEDMVQTMHIMEKAMISFRLMMQLRNRITQAYKEIMEVHQ